MLTVPVERSARQGAINDEWAYGGPNSAPFECARQAAIIGWLAWQVAVEVRRSNALPAYVPTHRFDENLCDRVARDAEAAERMREDFADRVALTT